MSKDNKLLTPAEIKKHPIVKELKRRLDQMKGTVGNEGREDGLRPLMIDYDVSRPMTLVCYEDMLFVLDVGKMQIIVYSLQFAH